MYDDEGKAKGNQFLRKKNNPSKLKEYTNVGGLYRLEVLLKEVKELVILNM